MPSSTTKQARIMSAISHGWRPSGLDIPVKVAKEFHEADKGHKYGAERAMGGVVPGMPMTPPGAAPMMGPPPMMPNQMPPVAPGMGVVPPAPMTPPMGLNGSMPGPAGAKPLSTGGLASPSPKMTTGPIVSAVPGRTDKHLTHVPSGSFVIPADIVSGHGEGNTLAGMNKIHQMFKMGQHNPSKIPGANPNIGRRFDKGGSVDKHVGKPVKVILAGGEVVVSPEHVLETMRRVTKKPLTLDEAHRAMDAWVIKERKKLVKTLKKLPGPASD
jgi:hypothetical protein